jgi:hypothetical protein
MRFVVESLACEGSPFDSTEHDGRQCDHFHTDGTWVTLSLVIPRVLTTWQKLSIQYLRRFVPCCFPIQVPRAAGGQPATGQPLGRSRGKCRCKTHHHHHHNDKQYDVARDQQQQKSEKTTGPATTEWYSTKYSEQLNQHNVEKGRTMSHQRCEVTEIKVSWSLAFGHDILGEPKRLFLSPGGVPSNCLLGGC